MLEHLLLACISLKGSLNDIASILLMLQNCVFIIHFEISQFFINFDTHKFWRNIQVMFDYFLTVQTIYKGVASQFMAYLLKELTFYVSYSQNEPVRYQLTENKFNLDQRWAKSEINHHKNKLRKSTIIFSFQLFWHWCFDFQLENFQFSWFLLNLCYFKTIKNKKTKFSSMVSTFCSKKFLWFWFY